MKYHYVWLIWSSALLLPWNPIYPGIVATIADGIGAVWCRPDLKFKTLIGGALFLGYYMLFMLGVFSGQHASRSRTGGMELRCLRRLAHCRYPGRVSRLFARATCTPVA